MPRLRIATYNVEWMNNLFEREGARLRTVPGKGIGRNPQDATAVARKIAAVMQDLDAQIIGVQEGPSRVEKMKLFVKQFLNDQYQVFGMEAGAQSNYALVRKGLPLQAKQIPKEHRLFALLRRPVVFQPWGEFDSKKTYSMARPPVLLQLARPGKQGLVEVVVAHTKSQFTRGFSAKKFREREPAAMKEAILSRQKLSADIAAYRRHVTHVILSEQASAVVLVGDINDGFTRSTFEKEFLMQSLIDELRGSFRRQNALLEHAFDQKQLQDPEAHTVVFDSPEQNGKKVRELIDHVVMTPAVRKAGLWLRLQPGSARIGHAISQRHTDNHGQQPDERPSDHVPVWADFEY
jgi:endonuclease/exonuclease/phosphatase family metal-dependent hydrolase